MKIKEDSSSFDVLHEGLLRGLFASVYTTLKEENETGSAQISEENLEGIVENIVFGVAAVIDGSAGMEYESKEIHPYITFKESRESDTLIVNDVGSYLHEMVMGYLDELEIEDLLF